MFYLISVYVNLQAGHATQVQNEHVEAANSSSTDQLYHSDTSAEELDAVEMGTKTANHVSLSNNYNFAGYIA